MVSWQHSGRTYNSGRRDNYQNSRSPTKQSKKESTGEDFRKMDDSMVDAAVGPIYVNGAEKGDTLKIEIESIETGTRGWSAIMKNFGVLSLMLDDKPVIWEI